jgi:hypothetical protein
MFNIINEYGIGQLLATTDIQHAHSTAEDGNQFPADVRTRQIE